VNKTIIFSNLQFFLKLTAKKVHIVYFHQIEKDSKEKCIINSRIKWLYDVSCMLKMTYSVSLIVYSVE